MAENTPGQVFGPGTPPSDTQQSTESSNAPESTSLPRQEQETETIEQPQQDQSTEEHVASKSSDNQPSFQPIVGGEQPSESENNVVSPVAPEESIASNDQPTAPENTIVSPIASEQTSTNDTQPQHYVDYSNEDDSESSPYAVPNDEPSAVTSLEPVTWTASEYIAHHKSPLWYGGFALSVLIVAAVVFFVSGRDILSTVAVVLVSVVFAIYAGRPPRVQEYKLSEAGVTIGQRTYAFADIKSFSLIEEGPFMSINFMPMKRFMPMLSIYFDPADEDKIVAFLTNYLPVEHRKKDLIDHIMGKVKF